MAGVVIEGAAVAGDKVNETPVETSETQPTELIKAAVKRNVPVASFPLTIKVLLVADKIVLPRLQTYELPPPLAVSVCVDAPQSVLLPSAAVIVGVEGFGDIFKATGAESSETQPDEFCEETV